jgi:GTPase Era involved in 16S rRNA processing
MRAASMAVDEIITEKLGCMGHKELPSQINVDKDVFNYEHDFELTT